MKKLIIQIPCLNEAQTLPVTLRELPREVQGYDSVEWMVIDDGSTDGTSDVARQHGVDHVVTLDRNRGLAFAYMTGIEACLERGAHTIVNTDADNQYKAECIPDLVRPILEKRAQMVVGARPIMQTEDFSLLKRLLQKLGSWVVRIASGTDVPDAPSGFRAIDREAAMRLNVFNNYTYTLETIIQAGRNNIQIVSVPVGTNRYMRPSRLVSSIPRYIYRSIIVILRIFIIYKPARFFGLLSLLFLVPAIVAILRFLILYSMGEGAGNVQSLTLGSGFLVLSGITLVAGMLSDLIAANRRLLEDIRYRMLRARYERAVPGRQADPEQGAASAAPED